ncbi:MAG: hypothetical protein SF097_20990 [Acidobacteriota bacterium]|nr:hypothetical protein [Acidobacteriota bacterium]
MKKSNLSLKTALMAVLTLFVVAGLLQVSFAQRPGGGGPPAGVQPDVLAGLKHALEDAGAPDLSTQQEEQLKALITQARNAGGPSQDNDAVMQARKAYEAAILAGNMSAANTAAQTMASAIAAGMTQGLQAKASFDVQVLAILKSNQQQFNALTARFGSKGVFHLVDSLIGGPGVGRPFGAGNPNGQGGPPIGGGRPGGIGGGRPGAPTRP